MKEKAWMNVLFLLWWYVYVTKIDQHTGVCAETLDLDKGSRITQITSQTGVYFDSMGSIYFFPTEWSLVTYVDLRPVKDLWRQTKQRIVTLSEMCNRLSNETWFIYTDCRPSAPYFQSKRRLVDRLKDILIDLVGQEQTRSKRDLFDFGGKILKFLFGTATEEEVTLNYDHIMEMEKDHKEILRIASEQLLVLKSTIVTMNSTSRDILRNEQKLKKILENLAHNVELQDTKLKYEIDTSLVLNELIKQIERGIEECQRTFDLLIDVYLHAQNGVLQPQIITIQKIKEVLTQETMPESTMFPPFSSAELISLIRPIIYTQGSFLVYVVKIPLILETRFTLYRVIPFPVIMQSNATTKVLNVRKEYSFVDSLNRQYGHISRYELEKCLQPNNLNYVCAEMTPIVTYVPNVDCVATLLHPNNQKIPDDCTFNYLPLRQVIWIPLHLSNAWLYVAPQLELFTTVCQDGQRHSDRLQGRGILVLRQDCKGLGSKSILYPLSHHETNLTKDDILPLVDVNIDCCLTLPEQEKIKDVPLNLPLSNIMASINEINSASLRIDEVNTLLEEQRLQEERRTFSWRKLGTSWYTYLFSLLVFICIWCGGCCCCSCCRKCTFWLFNQCSPKKWWADSRQICSNITFTNSSINQINVSSDPIPLTQGRPERRSLMSVHVAEVSTDQPKKSESNQSLHSTHELIELHEKDAEREQVQPLRRSDRVKKRELWSMYKN
ncbi:hypothetical protein B7P43_G13447 [Cryptotermes secundus]|uniref:Envelope fusion protein n=1 Tax=Cryptotermes secundus TaxID=105785 RepID=A0A2J7RRE9_9NEOP|nr:hypothetical protein B7P43_G13447 [Cryptotermes secundus]